MLLYTHEVLEFLKVHHSTPVSELALKNFGFEGFSNQELLQQLAGRQKAKGKFPFLQDYLQYRFPPSLNIEQASSEMTAKFKASLVEGEKFVDLTGGMGMDTFWMAKNFRIAHYVEKNPDLEKFANWNFKILESDHIQTHNQTAVEFLTENKEPFDTIFIDPSRRNKVGRVIAMENYEPNLKQIFPLIQSRAKQVLVKFSPMQDLAQIKNELPGLAKVWVISVGNDVKEVLATFDWKNSRAIDLSVLDYSRGNFKLLWEGKLAEKNHAVKLAYPEEYIYEPASALLKAGVQDNLAQEHSLKKLHPNSHLYTTSSHLDEYPGRIYKLLAVELLQKKTLKPWIREGEAHVVVRNFPMPADAIKKKLGLKEKGKLYLIATTIEQNSKVILITERIA